MYQLRNGEDVCDGLAQPNLNFSSVEVNEILRLSITNEFHECFRHIISTSPTKTWCIESILDAIMALPAPGRFLRGLPWERLDPSEKFTILFAAVEQTRTDVIDLLLVGRYVERFELTENMKFLIFCLVGALGNVDLLKCVSSRIPEGYQLNAHLKEATKYGHADLINYCLTDDSAAAIPASLREDMIIEAVRYNQLSMIKILQEAFGINLASVKHGYPILLASYLGYSNILSCILQSSASGNFKFSLDSSQLLNSLAKLQNDKRLSIAICSFSQEQLKEYCLPLMLAAQHGDYDMMHTLLSSGVCSNYDAEHNDPEHLLGQFYPYHHGERNSKNLKAGGIAQSNHPMTLSVSYQNQRLLMDALKQGNLTELIKLYSLGYSIPDKHHVEAVLSCILRKDHHMISFIISRLGHEILLDLTVWKTLSKSAHFMDLQSVFKPNKVKSLNLSKHLTVAIHENSPHLVKFLFDHLQQRAKVKHFWLVCQLGHASLFSLVRRHLEPGYQGSTSHGLVIAIQSGQVGIVKKFLKLKKIRKQSCIDSVRLCQKTDNQRIIGLLKNDERFSNHF